MTTSRRSLAALGLVAAATLGACARTVPMVNQTGAEFLGRASLPQRGDQIRAAAASLGWATESRGPGLVRATLNLRGHQAVVDIPYDQQRFRIHYVSSSNLEYDGVNIHRNYNSWIQNLQNAIVSRSADTPRA